jgi:hypothetical protein
MTPKQLVALVLVGFAYELVSAFDAQMRSKHSSRGNTDAHATATMEVDQFGATKKLHRYKKHRHATSNVAGRAPASNPEAKKKEAAEKKAEKEKAKKVLEDAAGQAEQILAGGDATAPHVKQWTRLHQKHCGKVLTTIRQEHVDGTEAHLHQLKDLAGYLKYATKQERKDCKQKCLDYKDESETTTQVGSLKKPQRCESIAYYDSTDVVGVEGYCVLFSDKEWVKSLAKRLNLDLFKVEEIQPVVPVDPVEQVQGAAEEIAADQVKKDEIEVPGPNTDLPETDAPTTSPAGDVASLLQGDDDTVIPHNKDNKETFIHFDEQDEDGNGDYHDCLANEWCCLERTDALHQIKEEEGSADLNAIVDKAIEPVNEKVAETEKDNAKEEVDIQGLNSEVKDLKQTVDSLHKKAVSQ